MLTQPKELIVVLILSTLVFYFAKMAMASTISYDLFDNRRNAWMIIALSAFIAPSIWVHFGITTATCIYYSKKEKSPLPLFMLLLLATLPINKEIPGLGPIRYLFVITHYRLLILTLLTPYVINLYLTNNQKSNKSNISIVTSTIIGYSALVFILYAQFKSVTENVRAIFMIILDIAIPYYAFAYSKLDRKQIIEILMMFALGVIALAPIALVEVLRNWPIFSSIQNVWGESDALMGYLLRDGLYRAQTTTGHSLVLGFVMMIALGAWSAIDKQITSKALKYLGYSLLLAGLIASLARGAWIGTLAAIITYAALSRNPITQLLKLTALMTALLVGIAMSPMGDKLVSILPFVGSMEQETITYRKLLLDYSIKILLDSPIFGNPYFLRYMEDLRQGQGIIDIVNVYLNISLQTGFVGLTLYIAGYIYVIFKLILIARETIEIQPEIHHMVRSLLTIIIGMLVTIASLSSIASVPYIYIIILGVSINVINNKKTLATAPQLKTINT